MESFLSSLSSGWPPQENPPSRPNPSGRLALFLMERANARDQMPLDPGFTQVDDPSTLTITPQFSALKLSSSASYIHRIPTELLVMVIEHLLVPDSDARWTHHTIHGAFPSMPSSPVTLSLVCRHWKDLIYSTPSCWIYAPIKVKIALTKEDIAGYTNGIVLHDAIPQASLDALDTRLRRSQPHRKLVIDIDIELKGNFINRTMASDHDLTVLFRRIWERLNPHWSRVVELALATNLSHASMPWASFSREMPKILPNLFWLTLVTTIPLKWDVSCPQLRKLTRSWPSGQGMDKLKLELGRPESFHLSTLRSASWLILFLKEPSFKELRFLTIHLDMAQVPSSWTQWIVVDLPSLISLTMNSTKPESTTAVEMLVRAIHAPQLRSLTLPALYPIPGSQTWAAALSLPFLDSLHIQLPNPYIHPLLWTISDACPELSRLKISGKTPQDRWSGIWRYRDLFPNVSDVTSEGIPLTLLKEFVLKRANTIRHVEVDWKDMTLPASAHHIEFRMLQESIDAIGERLAVRDAWKLSSGEEGRCRTWAEALTYNGGWLDPKQKSDPFTQWDEDAGMDDVSGFPLHSFSEEEPRNFEFHWQEDVANDWDLVE